MAYVAVGGKMRVTRNKPPKKDRRRKRREAKALARDERKAKRKERREEKRTRRQSRRDERFNRKMARKDAKTSLIESRADRRYAESDKDWATADSIRSETYLTEESFIEDQRRYDAEGPSRDRLSKFAVLAGGGIAAALAYRILKGGRK